MADLKNLYQDVILDHYRKPRNFYKLEHADREAEGHNPLCGDRLRIYLRMDVGVIRDICFEGAGCAIALASASMMTENLKGRTEGEARAIHDGFIQLLTGRGETQTGMDALGNLRAFASVRGYPVRVKCATLAWHALRAALDRRSESVSTE